MYAICKNKIVDHYRARTNQKPNAGLTEESAYFDAEDHWTRDAGPKDWHTGYNQPVETKEFYAVFEGCKEKLKDIQQTVFVMKYMDDFQSEEICKALDLTPSYYWVLIHRAKLHLRSCLEKNWFNNY